MTSQVSARRTNGLGRAGATIVFELKGYFRTPETVFFTFLFPLVLLAIFGTAFASMGNTGSLPDGTGGVSMAHYYLPGMIAAGLLLSGMQNLAIDIAREKNDGWLRRLGNSPVSPITYFIGKIGLTLVTAALQTALLIGFAALVFQVPVSLDAQSWLRFVWIFLLGMATMTLLGVTLSALPRSTRSASAVVLPIVLLLQFVSGVFLPFWQLPEWLQNIAAIFPLKWLAQGMRGVFLPGHFATMEPSGAWDFGMIAVNLAIWLGVGLVASLITFRWVRRS